MAEDNKKVNDEELNEEVEESEETSNSSPIEGLQEGIVSGITNFEFASQMKEAFLDYAVSTLTARSVPDARDVHPYRNVHGYHLRRDHHGSDLLPYRGSSRNQRNPLRNGNGTDLRSRRNHTSRRRNLVYCGRSC